MAGIVALVSAISDDVVSKLSAAGQPALIDGKIVIGRVREQENSSTPRVIFIPRGSRFGPRSNPTRVAPMQATNPLAPGTGVKSYTMTGYGGGYSNAPVITISAPNLSGGVQAAATAVVTSNGAISKVVPTVVGSGYTTPPTVTISDATGTGAGASPNMEHPAQTLAVLQQRSLLTDFVQFEVQCWNAASPNDPDYDFDAAQLLYQQVIASTHLLAPGIYTVTNGQWLDSVPNSTQLDLYGHVYRFMLELATPLTDAPLQFAPVGVQPVSTLSLQPFGGGTPEVGSTG